MLFMKKKTFITASVAATAAITATGTVASADSQVENPQVVVAQAESSIITQDMVDQKAKVATEAANQATLAESALGLATNEVASAENNVSQKEDYLNQLNEADTSKEALEQAHEAVAQAENTLNQAEADKVAAAATVEVTQKEAKETDEALKNAEAAETIAETNLKAAKDQVADLSQPDTALENAEKTAKEAEDKLNTAKTQVEVAETVLKAAEDVDKKAESLKQEAANKVAEETQAVKDVNTAVDKAQATVSATEDELAEASKVHGAIWSIETKIPEDAKKALNTVSGLLGRAATPGVTVDDFDGDYSAFVKYQQKIYNEAGKVLENHPDLQNIRYRSDEGTFTKKDIPDWFKVNIQSDDTIHNLWTLTEDDKKLINRFVVDLVNSIRKEAGLEEVKYYDEIRLHAEMKAKLYNEKYGNGGLSFSVETHDQDIIKQADNKFQLTTGENLGDHTLHLKQHGNSYRTPGTTHGNKDDYNMTMAEILIMVRDLTLRFILDDAHSNWGHTANFLGLKSVGVSVTPRDVPEDLRELQAPRPGFFMVTSGSTGIVNLTKVDFSNFTKENYGPDPVELARLENRLKAENADLAVAKSKAIDAGNALTAAQKVYDEASKKETLTPRAKVDLENAKVGLQAATEAYDTALENLDERKKDHEKRQQLLKEARQKMVEATKVLEEAKEVTKVAQEANDKAEKELAEAQKLLEIIAKKVTEAEKKVTDTKNYQEILTSVQKDKEQVKKELAEAKEVLSQAQAKWTATKITFENAKLLSKQADKAYQDILRDYELQNVLKPEVKPEVPETKPEIKPETKPDNLKKTNKDTSLVTTLVETGNSQVAVQKVSQFDVKEESQNTLPTTGTESSAAITAAGIAMLTTLGTVKAKRRKF